MNELFILGIVFHALYLILLLSAPMLLSALIVGLVVSILQAATQIQEQTLSFVPKIIATFIATMIAGPWIGSMLSRFTISLFQDIPRITNVGGP